MDVCPAGWASWRPCMAPQRNALRVNIPNLTLQTRYEAVDSPELLQSVVILVAGTKHFILGARAQRVELWSCFRNLKAKFPPPWTSKSPENILFPLFNMPPKSDLFQAVLQWKRYWLKLEWHGHLADPRNCLIAFLISHPRNGVW